MHYFRLRSFFVLTEITKKFRHKIINKYGFIFMLQKLVITTYGFGMKCLIYDGMPVMTIIL